LSTVEIEHWAAARRPFDFLSTYTASVLVRWPISGAIRSAPALRKCTCPAQTTPRLNFSRSRWRARHSKGGADCGGQTGRHGVALEPLDLFERNTEQLAQLNLGTGRSASHVRREKCWPKRPRVERARTLHFHAGFLLHAIPEIGKRRQRSLHVVTTLESVLITTAPATFLDYHEKREHKSRQLPDRQRHRCIYLIKAWFRVREAIEAKTRMESSPKVGPVVPAPKQFSISSRRCVLPENSCTRYSN